MNKLFILMGLLLAVGIVYATGNQGRGMSIDTPVSQTIQRISDDPNFFLNVSYSSPVPVLRVNLSNMSSVNGTVLNPLIGFYNITCRNYGCNRFNNKLTGLNCNATFCSKLIRIDEGNATPWEYWEDIGFPFPNQNQFVLMDWGNETATVNITTVTNFWRIASGDNSTLNLPRYSIDILSSYLGTGAVVGGAQNMTVFNYVLGTISERAQAQINVSNSSRATAVLNYNATNNDYNITESGPVRIHVQIRNTTSNCLLSGSNSPNICTNWTRDIYAYPRNILFFDNITGNYSTFIFDSWDIVPTSNPGSNHYRFRNDTNFTLDGVIGTTLIDSGGDQRGNFTKNLLMLYNNTSVTSPSPHNRTLLIFPSQFLNSTIDTTYAYTSLLASEKLYRLRAVDPNDNITGAVNFGFGLMFGYSANTTQSASEIFRLDFNESWRAFRFPLEIIAVNGTAYQGRYNASGTYNLTPSGNNITRFNISTNSDNHTYPVFHIQNMSCGSNNFVRDFSANTSWTNLTNGTQILTQEGNSSFRGYYYCLFMWNGTLGNNTNTTYEFYISNQSVPAPNFYEGASLEPDADTRDSENNLNRWFNISVNTNASIIANMTMELNVSGILTNYSARTGDVTRTDANGSIYYARVPVVPIGNHTFRWLANDTGNMGAVSRNYWISVTSPGGNPQRPEPISNQTGPGGGGSGDTIKSGFFNGTFIVSPERLEIYRLGPGNGTFQVEFANGGSETVFIKILPITNRQLFTSYQIIFNILNKTYSFDSSEYGEVKPGDVVVFRINYNALTTGEFLSNFVMSEKSRGDVATFQVNIRVYSLNIIERFIANLLYPLQFNTDDRLEIQRSGIWIPAGENFAFPIGWVGYIILIVIVYSGTGYILKNRKVGGDMQTKNAILITISIIIASILWVVW